ncbi:MAG: protein kinase domain-containing protein, partial [Burkholderiaceae bacterium]
KAVTKQAMARCFRPVTSMNISPETWPTLNTLLEEALSLPAEARDSWVESLPGEHAALKDTLRELLSRASGVETEDFLATLPRFTRVAASGPLTELAAGDAIGPYRLLSELGSGGMGAVWLAERADGALKREVALKLPRMVWAKGLAERMARERDILATLEHPNIARLYDAGVDQHGRPYLALEYVEGRPIDVYVKERGLSVRHRLDLLLQVCAAVAFAHSRLVVHRDLKPSNILVTADGQVRLLDFGIAKLMEGDSTRETQLTQLAGRALTLDYASPEQINGEPIGTASDVYSLGVVAYEVLTGAKPYRLKRGSAAELEEAIATLDAPRASDAAGDPGGKRALRGDVDAILNKALKKDIGERYGTVDALAQDIARHLNKEPVNARPDAFGYRASKFFARYRLQVAAGTAVVRALALGLSTALWQAEQAQQQRDRAQAGEVRARDQAERAEAIKRLLFDVLRQGDTGAGGRPASQVTLRDIADAIGQDVGPRLSKYPDAEFEVSSWLATLYRDIDAQEQAQTWFDRSLAAMARDSGAIPPDARLNLRLQIAQTAVLAGNVPWMRQSVDALDADLAGAGSAGERYRAHALYLQGRVRAREGRPPAEVLSLFEQAAALFERDDPDSTLRLFNVTTLVTVLSTEGRDAEALRRSDEAVQLAKAQRDRPASLADALSVRGRLKLDIADYAGARVDLLEARERYLALDGPESFVTVQNEALLARALVGTGEINAGLAKARAAVDAMERVRPGSHSLAQVMEWQGNALQSARRLDEAQAAFERALAIRQNVLKQSPRVLAATWLLLASAANEAGDRSAAARYLGAVEQARDARPFHTRLETSYERMKAAVARP